MKRTIAALLALLFILAPALSGCSLPQELLEPSASSAAPVALEEVPAFSGEPFVELDGNQPDFSPEETAAQSFESYSPLDSLGRCGAAFACLGQDLMPTEDRESISEVHPSGWVQAFYDFVDGEALFNRCHLIGFQLTGENANERNLITGTRYLNVEGMLPFENMVADYIKETGNHVLYRVTPVFQGDELVARGVVMEALSVEDEGEGICFHIYAYNNQPGVTIDYATGESRLEGETQPQEGEAREYVLNTNSLRFHLPDCPSVGDISPDNREGFYGSREELLARGYQPCGSCSP